MDFKDPLLVGKKIYLASIDHDADPEVESSWTHDLEYMRLINPQPARPLAPVQVKKRYSAIEKEAEESKRLFYFTIRSLENDRLLGFARLYAVDWTNGNGFVQVGIGDSADRGRGYGSETLHILLRYAFTELNLFRVSVILAEYNEVALYLCKKFGFVEEVRRRQALNRDGRRWDMIHLGILRDEWNELHGGDL
jgi:RimJ/RimL family protein N-acetyltransferase